MISSTGRTRSAISALTRSIAASNAPRWRSCSARRNRWWGRTRPCSACSSSSRFERSLRTFRDGDWKYIKASDKRDELYHVRRDPLELENLVEKERQVRDTLRAKLEDWERQARSDVTRDPAQRLDRATRDQLKRFGY